MAATSPVVSIGDDPITTTGEVLVDTPVDMSDWTSATHEKRDPDYDCAQSCVAPWNDADPISEFNGFGVVNIEGAVYMPHNRLELGGTGDIFTERVVADRIYINGTLEIVIDYQGERSILGDFNQEYGGLVDLYDLLYFVDWWLVDYDVLADLNYDHRVDLADLAIIAENWSPFY